MDVNGVTRISASDATFSSGQVGVWSYQPSSARAHSVDDFTIVQLGASLGGAKALAKPIAAPRAQTAPQPPPVVTKYYPFNGQRVAIRKNNVVTWLHADMLGSASLATDASGNAVSGSDTRYTPYGEVRPGGGGLPTDRLFTGYAREQVSYVGALDFAQARYYSRYLGRFISADSIVPGAGNPQAWNRYSYGLNSPLSYIDVDGHVPYPITIRSFAPFAEFGAFGSPGGAYHGDNRGYSTNPSASARVTQSIAFDTDLTTVQQTARSDPTWLMANPSDRRIGKPESRVTNPLTISPGQDTRTFTFGTWYGGGNPFVPLPGGVTQIDVFASFTIIENRKTRTLDITAVLTGDNFPSTEAYISDPSGQSVFIGIGFYESYHGKDRGPIVFLPGQNQRPISNMSLQIGLDNKGNFLSVQNGGRSYTIAQWNRLFTLANPHDGRTSQAK